MEVFGADSIWLPPKGRNRKLIVPSNKGWRLDIPFYSSLSHSSPSHISKILMFYPNKTACANKHQLLVAMPKNSPGSLWPSQAAAVFRKAMTAGVSVNPAAIEGVKPLSQKNHGLIMGICWDLIYFGISQSNP